MNKVLLSLVLLLSLSSAYAGSCYEGDVADCKVKAEQGGASAQYLLGKGYLEGNGVPQHYKQAAKWFRKAAEQGHAKGQTDLGWMYYSGKGVLQDYKQAVKWFQKAAEQGDAIAQNNLGVMYSKGKGVLQDYKQAVKWYQKAAEQGHAEAQNSLLELNNNPSYLRSKPSKNWSYKKISLSIVILIWLVYIWLENVRPFLDEKQQAKAQRDKEQKAKQEEEFYRQARGRQKNSSKQEEDSQNEKTRRESEQQKRSRGNKHNTENHDNKKRTDEQILGVSPGYTKKDLKDAYRRKCQQTHPDKWKGFPDEIAHKLETEFKEVQSAYERLKNKQS